MNTFNNAIAAIIKNDGNVIDDHCMADEPQRKCYGVGRYLNGDQIEHAVFLNEKDYFCLNPIKIDDNGIPHLGRWSVGGLVSPQLDLNDLNGCLHDDSGKLLEVHIF